MDRFRIVFTMSEFGRFTPNGLEFLSFRNTNLFIDLSETPGDTVGGISPSL
jgi:hypothetical protein